MAYGSRDQQSSAPIGKAASLSPSFSPCQARTRHLSRGIDGVFEIVRVIGRGLVSIAEVHAILARAHLAQSEPEMARDRFGLLERHGFVKSSSGSVSKAVGTARDAC